MLLKQVHTDHLIEVLDLKALIDPTKDAFQGRLNVGQEPPAPEMFKKTDVCFPSDESLPRAWLDAHYRDAEVKK